MVNDNDFTSPDFQMNKHSVVLDGHRTSVSLENAFWERLNTIADERGQSVNKLITQIDHARTTNLSSAIRVFVLRQLSGRD